MTEVERLAAFVVRAAYEDLSEEARRELKIRVLDALGCAIGAMEGPPIEMIQAQQRLPLLRKKARTAGPR